MTEEQPMIIPYDLFRRMSNTVDSCRDLAFQLRKDYIYDQCVQLQREIEVERRKYFDSQEDEDDEDEDEE
jgi:hypothetical protein